MKNSLMPNKHYYKGIVQQAIKKFSKEQSDKLIESNASVNKNIAKLDLYLQVGVPPEHIYYADRVEIPSHLTPELKRKRGISWFNSTLKRAHKKGLLKNINFVKH